MMNSLTDLIERVRSGSGEDRELDGDIAEALAVFVEGWNRTGAFEWTNMLGNKVGPRPYTTSLDAVVRLVEEKLPGWGINLEVDFAPAKSTAEISPFDWVDGERHVQAAETPARALLAALLLALQAQEGK